MVCSRSFLPLEEHYSYHDFFSPALSDTDIEAKPFVLLIGQYSVGKVMCVCLSVCMCVCVIDGIYTH